MIKTFDGDGALNVNELTAAFISKAQQWVARKGNRKEEPVASIVEGQTFGKPISHGLVR